MSTITKANKANIPPQQTTISVSVDSNGNVVTNSKGDPVQNVVAEGVLSGTPSTISQTVTTSVVEIEFDPPIKGMSVEVLSGAASPDVDEALLICAGAPDSTVAALWLTEANSGVPRFCVKAADGIKDYYFNGASVSLVHMIGRGTTPDLDVTVTGVV